ncbi:MAG: carboxypeptidase regulatory-like domain-containing protein, partial [Bryobacteraceae bacterium]|nr:carboxypeptidase regulatory-like domain-containing protein [Bryobacteraceae bacterium]
MRQTLTIAALSILLQASAAAQQITGSIVGAVTDPSGAVVPNAVLTIVNVNTNASRQARTDASGNYSVPFLPAGTYRLTSMASGFQQNVVDGVSLQVGQTSRVDVQLQVGDTSQTVEVQGLVAVLQTENPTVGAVLDGQKIVDLPLNGRNFAQLAHLIPGIQPGTPGSITVRRGRGSIGQVDSPFGSTGMSANGIRDTANRYFIDGVESMDGDAFSYAFSPSIDSLAEFKVETSSYSAENGAAPGAQISLITKSGTNTFHGTLWEFNRNDALTSAYNAIGGVDLKAPRLNRNQFGANIGGPVRLPGLYNGTDRTFFFFNWEAGRQALGAVAGFRIVPTQAQRNGDLSGLVDARTGQPLTLKDPLGVGIVNNRIPQSALSPQAQTILSYTAMPNTQNGIFNFINTPQSPVSKQDNYTARIDHNFSTKDIVSARYVFNDTVESGTPFWGNDERNNLARTQNVSTSYVRAQTALFVNQLRVGWNRMQEFELFGTTNNPAFDIAGQLGIPLTSRRPEDFGPPRVQIDGPEGGFSVFDIQNQIGPRDRGYEVWQITDGVSWQRGRHLLKFGAEFNKRYYTKEQARDPRGLYRFDGSFTGSGLADFLLGYPRGCASAIRRI